MKTVFRGQMVGYRTRLVDPLIGTLLRELPALLLVGPRATGKTTTAARHARTVIRLDRDADAAAFRADPDAALRELEEPVLLDEWQAVPSVLGALKRAVDADPRPGRFLVTGSVRADLEQETWPGTGRLVRVSMFGMTVKEQLGRVGTPAFLDRIADGSGWTQPAEPPDLNGYIDLALRGGFPEAALGLSEAARMRWLESYVDQMLTHDAELVDGGRDPARLRRYFEAYTLNSAGIVEDKTLLEAAGINRKTGTAYEQLLTNLFLAERLPAWTSNRLKRLVLAPKRYLIDPALAVGLVRVDARSVRRDGDLLGRLLETFVASQLRAELPICVTRPRLYHLRQEQGRHEIDVLAELGAERIVAIEVKADAAPTTDGAKHLAWLRDTLGDRFCAGVVLHTGPRVYSLGERLTAAPICALWS